MTDTSEQSNRESMDEAARQPVNDDSNEIEVEIKGAPVPEEAPEEEAVVEAEAEVAEPAQPPLEQKLLEAQDRNLRLAAEFDNYRKRTARQFGELRETAIGEVLEDLLTVQDNFHRALEIAESKTDLPSFKMGVEMIFEQLKGVLSRNGVEPFDSVGEKFDPSLHEAMMMVESNDHNEGTVVEEMSKGYRIKDRVVRHAKVAVARGKDSD